MTNQSKFGCGLVVLGLNGSDYHEEAQNVPDVTLQFILCLRGEFDQEV